jgi:DNA polymerase-3 subunit epsilon
MISRKISLAFPDEMVLLDCETTGGKATRDRITEIAVLVVKSGEVVSQFQTLINPECTIPPWIEGVTGIRQEQVNQAPTFAQIAEELASLLHNRVLVAHNARFDYGFIKNEFKRIGVAFSAKTLCSVKLSRRLYPQFKRHGLDQIIQRLGIQVESRHRAMDDTQVIWQFFEEISQTFDDEEIDAVCSGLLKRPALPSHLEEGLIDNIPNRPGVYHFLDEKGGLLYVGKSVRLRDRVLSHFNSDHSVAKDLQMSPLIHHIEWFETPSDFGAQLLENRHIKTLNPKFNRRLKKISKLYQIKLEEDKNGYLTCQISQAGEIPSELADSMGLFRNRRQAIKRIEELADRFQLCHRLTGLEKKKSGSCFAHQLKKCLGACCGKEPVSSYNLRMQEAFKNYQKKVWPWRGPIVVAEGDRSDPGAQAHYHLVDQWCYLGQVFEPAECHEISRYETLFELDAYLILLKFLNDEARMKRAGLKVQELADAVV